MVPKGTTIAVFGEMQMAHDTVRGWQAVVAPGTVWENPPTVQWRTTEIEDPVFFSDERMARGIPEDLSPTVRAYLTLWGDQADTHVTWVTLDEVLQHGTWLTGLWSEATEFAKTAQRSGGVNARLVVAFRYPEKAVEG